MKTKLEKKKFQNFVSFARFLFFLSTSNIIFYFLSIIIVFITNVFKPYRTHILKKKNIILNWKKTKKFIVIFIYMEKKD